LGHWNNGALAVRWPDPLISKWGCDRMETYLYVIDRSNGMKEQRIFRQLRTNGFVRHTHLNSLKKCARSLRKRLGSVTLKQIRLVHTAIHAGAL
jgi:hypothetical protein